jgi:hypothetical protein
MLKKSKRATKPTHQDTTNMNRHSDRRESTTGNTGLAKWLSDTQAIAQKPLRQARKRCRQFCITQQNKIKNEKIFNPIINNFDSQYWM